MHARCLSTQLITPIITQTKPTTTAPERFQLQPSGPPPIAWPHCSLKVSDNMRQHMVETPPILLRTCVSSYHLAWACASGSWKWLDLVAWLLQLNRWHLPTQADHLWGIFLRSKCLRMTLTQFKVLLLKWTPKCLKNTSGRPLTLMRYERKLRTCWLQRFQKAGGMGCVFNRSFSGFCTIAIAIMMVTMAMTMMMMMMMMRMTMMMMMMMMEGEQRAGHPVVPKEDESVALIHLRSFSSRGNKTQTSRV